MNSLLNNKQLQTLLPGMLFIVLFSCTANYLAGFDFLKAISFSPLIIGILIGMLYANLFGRSIPDSWRSGITFSAKKILRLAIILYGFRLTLHNIVQVGVSAVWIDIVVIIITLVLGVVLGKLLKLDREIALLTATGSAICGAAAILGAESALNNKPYKTAIGVSTVIIFGTLAMFVYPLLYRTHFFALTPQQWSLYTGATVHEVAHVVGASNAMSQNIASGAIIVKMIRVIFLAPVLLVFAFWAKRAKAKDRSADVADAPSKAKITIPWFAFGFILVILIHSFCPVSGRLVEGINGFDTFLLTMAMTALGIETDLKKFKQSGFKPFVLALILFVWLIFGGVLLVKLVTGVLA